MTSELCPKCRVVRDLTVTTTTVQEVQPDGSRKKIRTDAYHCATCHSFLRSEVTEASSSEAHQL